MASLIQANITMGWKSHSFRPIVRFGEEEEDKLGFDRCGR